MKSKLFLICLCLFISACQKQSEDQKNSPDNSNTEATTVAQPIFTPADNNSADTSTNPQQQHNDNTKQAFDTADQHISQLMDRIEDPDTDANTRKQILCHDYPTAYQNQYIPALLKLSENSTRETLLSEFNFILTDYKNRYGVVC